MLATFETFSVPSENRKWAQYFNTSENFVQVFWTNHMNIVTLLICLKNLWWLKRMNQCSQIQCSWGQKRDRLMKPKAGGCFLLSTPNLQQQPAALTSVSCQYKALWCGECSLSYSTGKLLHLLIRVLLEKQVGLPQPLKDVNLAPTTGSTGLNCLWLPSCKPLRCPLLLLFGDEVTES